MNAKPPRGLLGMILLVAAVEWYVVRHDLDFSNTAALGWRYAEARARTARNCDVLCLGSSLSSTGVLPRLIEERVGKPACNLAVAGGTTPTSYFLLKRALGSGAHPRIVVFDNQDTPVERDDRGHFAALWRYVRLWPELLTLPECLDLSWTARDPSFLGMMVVSKVLPSVRARFEIREDVVAALKGERTSKRTEIAGLDRNLRLNRGAQVMAARGRDDEGADPLPGGPPLSSERWVSDRVSEAYRRRLITLLADRGIAVFWTFPPISPRLTRWREQSGLDAFYTRHALEAQAQVPDVTLIDGRPSQYPARVFADSIHLGKPGAVAYSHDLASVVARYLGAPAKLPKSITLPPYQDRSLAAPPEDVFDSTRAVAIQKARRRRMR